MGVEWIDRRVRMPQREDADSDGCILVYNIHSGIRISNPENFARYGGVCETHWAKMPPRPVLDAEYMEEVRAR